MHRLSKSGSLGNGVALALAVLLCASFYAATAAAQQGAAPQEVPSNRAPHPGPEQPVPYSHQTHLALGLTCATCHTQPEGAREMGFPPASTCMSCHNAIAVDQPSIVKLTELAASGAPIAWQRVYQVLPGVTWSHEPHLAAGIDCGACHGNVAGLDQMSMTTAVTAMASCISCHEAHAANSTCDVCHAWPTPALLSREREQWERAHSEAGGGD